MKKIIFLLLFIPFLAKAQYTPMSAFGYQMKYFKADSGATVPFRDTTIGRGINRPGGLVVSTHDSVLYYYNGVKWLKPFVDSTGLISMINKKVDSVIVNGAILYYWVNGVAYGQTLPVGDTTQHATATNTGFLSNIDWSRFNAKSDSFTLHKMNDSVWIPYYWINGTSHVGGDTLFTHSGGSGSGTVLSVTGSPSGLVDNTDPANPVVQQDASKLNISDTSAMLSPYLTSIDTTNIPNFAHKVRSLFSATSPIVYNSGTGGFTFDSSIIHTSAYNDARYLKVTDTTDIIVSNQGSGKSLAWGNNTDSLFFSRLQAGANVTLTKNADSSVTINSSGGSGSGLPMTANITTLINYSASDTVVYVIDSLRGGIFKYVTSGVTPDSGTVFNANGKGGGYWKRQMNNQSKFWVTWFGAVGDGVTNDGPAITLATWAAYRKAGNTTVYFPNKVYIDSDTLSTSATFSGGIRYGGCNCQIPIPDNQTPFSGPIATHPLKNITFEGESAPNMFMSRLVPYPINTSGAIIYSTIQGSGTLPSVIGATGDSWAYGNINDCQFSMKNMNIRVRSNVSTGIGPTMSALAIQKISSLGTFEFNLFDLDTALYYAVYPTALTIGYYLPYANNSAFNPINNIAVGGYKIGGLFSEHTTGNNLSFSVNEYAIASIGAPHSLYFGRIGSQWNKYTLASATPDFASLGNAYIKISELDMERDTVTSSWTFDRYSLYDSLNKFVGDITYHNVDRGTGVNETGFTKLGGTNPNLAVRYLGQYADTTSAIGFATLNKAKTDSLAAISYANSKMDSLRNNGGVLEARKNGVFVPQLSFPASGGGSSIFSRYGTDSLKAVAQNYYRVSVFDTGYARFNVVTNSLGTSVNDSSGISTENKTAAALGAQQYSSYNSQTARVWATTGSASHTVTFGTYVQPVQGATGTANFIFGYGYDHATPSTVLTLSSAGALTIPSSLSVNGTSTQNGISNTGTVSSSGQITTSRNGAANTLADGIVSSNATASTSGVPQQFACMYRSSGTAWDGSASKTADWYFGIKPINGTSPIGSKFSFSSQINAGGYNDVFDLYAGGQAQTTLVSGTKAITINGLTTSSLAHVQLISVGGTVTTTWQYSAVCTANTLTITALTSAGATNTADTSTLSFLITF